jgi:hypothetical protein
MTRPPLPESSTESHNGLGGDGTGQPFRLRLAAGQAEQARDLLGEKGDWGDEFRWRTLHHEAERGWPTTAWTAW